MSELNQCILTKEDKVNIQHIKFAQGTGAVIKYANELRAVQHIGRLPFLQSSHLHEDVLRNKLGPGSGFEMFNEDENDKRRVLYL